MMPDSLLHPSLPSPYTILAADIFVLPFLGWSVPRWGSGCNRLSWCKRAAYLLPSAQVKVPWPCMRLLTLASTAWCFPQGATATVAQAFYSSVLDP